MRRHHWHPPHDHRATDGQPDTVRAATIDREAAAERLRRYHTDGRLTDDEFQQRLEQSMAARTLGELRALEADMPNETTRRPAWAGPGPGWGRGPRGPRFLLPLLLFFGFLWAAAHHGAWHHGYHVGHGWFPWPLLLVGVAAVVALRRRRPFFARATRWA